MDPNDTIQTEQGITTLSILNVEDEAKSENLKAAALDGFDFSFFELKPQLLSDNHIVSESFNDTDIPHQTKSKSSRSFSRGRRCNKVTSKRAYIPRERHVIQHNYHDHSNDRADFDEYTGEALELESPKKKGGVAVPFPLKLHELLEKVEEEGLQHIVSWCPHGRAFVVHEPKKFVADLMPKFFRQTKLTSFQRQLNLYGFSRLTRGADAGGYYHELFLRSMPHLTRRMVRTKIKGTGYKAASNPAMEPDFYRMSPVGPGLNNNSDSNMHFYSDTATSNIPIVTPTMSTLVNNNVMASTLSDQQIYPVPLNPFTAGSISSDPQSRNPSKPFLKPRHQSPPKSVQMGHEFFHYMESANYSSNSAQLSNNDEDCSRSSITPSPILFEKISSEETSVSGHDEDPSQDPLSIFLKDMGGDFDDELLFTSDIEAEKDAANPPQHPYIYEV